MTPVESYSKSGGEKGGIEERTPSERAGANLNGIGSVTIRFNDSENFTLDSRICSIFIIFYVTFQPRHNIARDTLPLQC